MHIKTDKSCLKGFRLPMPTQTLMGRHRRIQILLQRQSPQKSSICVPFLRTYRKTQILSKSEQKQEHQQKDITSSEEEL